jgi:2-polyprenyl-6-methoxyphenol hydroxylase-like FAD-dependent oxidoreductase
VTLFERVPHPGPVGAGFLLQPTGLAVLGELGLLPEILRRAAPVDRLLATTVRGRTVTDLSYSDLGEGHRGFGLHRGVLLEVFLGALARTQVELRCGVDVVRLTHPSPGKVLLNDAAGRSHGPFDLVVVADGARSVLRAASGLVRRARTYGWGALWFMGRDADRRFDGTLRQVLEGTRRMVGMLPTGHGFEDPPGSPGLVSLFWSLRCSELEAWRRGGLAQWKEEALRVVPQLEPILAQISEPEQLTFTQYQDVVMPRWDAEGVVFLGDSAHAMSPQLGQGVNLALCDALALAEAVATLPLREALPAYSARRRRHLAFYQWVTRALTPFFQSDAVPLGWLRDVFMGPLCAIPPIRRLMLRSMAGISLGLLRRPLTLGPPPLALLQAPGAEPPAVQSSGSASG